MEETSEQTWITRDGIANLKQGNDTSIKVFEQRLKRNSRLSDSEIKQDRIYHIWSSFAVERIPSKDLVIRVPLVLG